MDGGLEKKQIPPLSSGGAGAFSNIGLGLGGIAYGLFLAWNAFLMAGAGHGWCGPMLPSLLIAFAPAIMGFSRGTEYARPTATVTLLLCLVLDYGILKSAFDDERTYFEKVWDSASSVVITWTLMWVGVHVLALLLRFGRRAFREQYRDATKA